MFLLKSLRIIVKRNLNNHLNNQRTLHLGFCVLWHLLVNTLLPSLALGYIVYLWHRKEKKSLPYFVGKMLVSDAQGSETYLQASGRKYYLYFTCSDLCVRLFVSYSTWKGQMKVLFPAVPLLLTKVPFPKLWLLAWQPVSILSVQGPLCFLFQLNLFQEG